MRRNGQGSAGAEPLDSTAVVEGATFKSSRGKGTTCQCHYIGDGGDEQFSKGLHQNVGRIIRGPHKSIGGPEHTMLRNKGA